MDVTNPSPPGGSKNRRPDAIGGLRRDDRFARRVALQWRRLIGSGGSRTLIACSGGADSTALLLALALASRELVVGHVLHDLRARADAEADRDFVRVLADRLGLPFVEAEVRVAACPGNAESNARRERYRSLARLASAHNCLFVATAHHADDQFETMLMALTRGCGPGGLRGIAPSRVLPESETDRVVTLIRPMLHVTRAEARAACASAGIAWREDRTNTDTSRFRAALRAEILPLTAALRPESARRAARTAELLREASLILDEKVALVFGHSTSWSRSELRAQSGLILGSGLRRSAARVLGERLGDRLSSRLIDAAVRAIRDDSTEPREFQWPGGLIVRVTAGRVEMTR